MHHRCPAAVLIITGLFLSLSLAVPVRSSALASQGDAMKASSALIEKVYVQGSQPVIVRLRDGNLPFGLFRDKAKPRSEVIKGLQSRVLDDVFAKTARNENQLRAKRFQMVPAMALQVDVDGLEALLANPNVIDVVEDQLLEPSLEESVPLIGGDSNDTFYGYTGQGQTIAIIDTGVDKNHPFLQGKVVSEACYSTNRPESGVSSLCPGGVESSTARGSGLDCDSSISQCDHGTHVAGIAAGKNSSFSGVAKDASIIAIQVFSKFDDCGSSPSPCAQSYSSDVLRGLERVYALRNSYQIASVNLSLGGGLYEAFCDNSSFKPIIDSLRAAGIATVISSGNDGSTTSVTSPACISTAVSVGSTTKSDSVSSFSNSADFMSLLAPGSSIESSVPGTGYRSKSGTSMASPHVAGAWAVIRQVDPGASVSEVLDVLQDTGRLVIDTRAGADNRSRPRIDVQAALAGMGVAVDCSDDVFCNGVETSADGVCIDGTPPCGGSTPLCDEARDRCVECFNSSDCSDGVFCNGIEICSSGRCIDGAAPCSGDSICDEADERCMECQSDSDCSDGLFCNGIETCSAGTCVDGQETCSGDTSVCDEVEDECVECLDNSDCSDGVFCNGEEICSGGACVDGTAPCDASESLCDEGSDACVECLDSSDCGDGVFCNGEEICSGGACFDGTAPCDDTAPICDEESSSCFECTDSSDCQPGLVCSQNLCVEAGELDITYKELSSEKLRKKPKKLTLKITGGDDFDPHAAIEFMDPRLTVVKTKYKSKKNTLTVKVLVPVGFPKKTVDVWVGDCMGTMEIM